MSKTLPKDVPKPKRTDHGILELFRRRRSERFTLTRRQTLRDIEEILRRCNSRRQKRCVSLHGAKFVHRSVVLDRILKPPRVATENVDSKLDA